MCPQEGHMCHQPAWDRDATTLEPSDLEGGAAFGQHKSIKCWRKMGINTIKGGERSQKSFKALSCSPGDHNWHPTAWVGAAGRRSCSLGGRQAAAEAQASRDIGSMLPYPNCIQIFLPNL